MTSRIATVSKSHTISSSFLCCFFIVSGKGLFFCNVCVTDNCTFHRIFAGNTWKKIFFFVFIQPPGALPPPADVCAAIYLCRLFFFVFFNRVRIIIYSCRQTRFGIARRSAVARKLIYTTCTFDGGESPFPLGTSPTPLGWGRYFPCPLFLSARHTHTFIPAASPHSRTGPSPTYCRAGELARCSRSARRRIYLSPSLTLTDSSFGPS